MSFEAGVILSMTTCDDVRDMAAADDVRLVARSLRLHELVKVRDHHFRRSVMADSAMAVMLSLFLGELKGIALSRTTLALVNMLEDDDAQRVIDSLILAGLAVATGENPEQRSVGLTPLGSARMRSFVGNYPEA